MSVKNTINVGCAGEDNAVIILVDIDTVEVRDKAKVGEWWAGFTGQLQFVTDAFEKGGGNGF